MFDGFGIFVPVGPAPAEGYRSLQEMGFKTAAMALSDNSVSIDDAELMAEPRLAIVMGSEGTACHAMLSTTLIMW